jgi:hypothetical protein
MSVSKDFVKKFFYKRHSYFHCAGVRLTLLSKGKGLPLHVTQAQSGGSYIALLKLHPAPQPGTHPNSGHAVAQLVKALRYKPEGRSLMVSLQFFIDTILPAALWNLGSTHPLTEMSTKNVSWE